MGFPGGAVVKNPPANAGDVRRGYDPWVGKIPWSRKLQPTPISLTRKLQGQGSLEGYSPWGHTELETTEHTHTHTCTHTYMRRFVIGLGLHWLWKPRNATVYHV